MVKRDGFLLRGGARAFSVCAAAYLVGAGAIAALEGSVAITRAWWLVAFLALVGGVAQLLLGPGLLQLAERVEARAPAIGLTELVLWNAGTAMVAIADLVPSPAGVLVGSLLLILALARFAGATRSVRASARRGAGGWVGAYLVLLGFLVLSVATGALLARARHG
jgi:hypothetical protein